MSTGRVLWIIWCLMWAGAWFLGGLLTLVGIIICWPLAALSLVAILLPVGSAAKPATTAPSQCPACGAVGDPALLGAHWQAAHGPQAGQRPGQLGPAGMAGPPRVIEQQPYGQGPPVQQQYGPARQQPSYQPHRQFAPPPQGPPG